MDDKVQMSSYFSPDAYCVFIPYTTMGELADTQYLDTLVFQSVDPMQQRQAIRQVREELGGVSASTRPTSARSTSTTRSRTCSTIGGITNGLKVVLTFIGVLTLAIGGVGIMNIMFVSVKERTREIGIRKALGARRREILLAVPARRRSSSPSSAARPASLLSVALVWIFSPRPFLAELLDDMTRRDRHPPGAVAGAARHLHGDPDGRRPRRGPPAGAARLAPRSDRVAQVR